MNNERRVKCKQFGVVLENERDATASCASQPRIFASLDVAVMHERGAFKKASEAVTPLTIHRTSARPVPSTGGPFGQ
jgi:hypothetical protein